MAAKKLSVVNSMLFTLLLAQMTSVESLQAASSNRGRAPTPAVARNRVERLSRPVRPDGAEPSSPSVGEEVFAERYPDGGIRIEREVALDDDGNYVNHGPYRMWSRDGKLIAEGDYNMGVREGIWTRWADRKESPLLNQPPFKMFDAPFLSQASFVNGVMEGEWLIFDAKQRKCSQISIASGKRNGLALLWAPDGTLLRQSNFENGVPQGDVLQLNVNKGELERVKAFLNGREVITKKTRYPRSQQIKTEANYLAAPTVEKASDDFWSIQFANYVSEGDDLRHGVWNTWHPNGKLYMRGSYAQDQKEGHFIYWHTNGQIAAEGMYRNDKYEGDWVWWHSNGQKAVTGAFRNGNLVDLWRWWDEAGRLTKQTTHDGSESISLQEPAELNLGMQKQSPSKTKR